MAHQSAKEKRKEKGNISGFVLVWEHKNDTLMVASGCTTKSSSVNLQTEILLCNTAHKNACNNQSNFSTWAPFMASIMWTESRAQSWMHIKASTDEAAQHAKSRLDAGETFKKILRLRFPPDWNAGARPRIPHRGSTLEHSVPSVRTQTDPASHGRVCVCVCVCVCVFPHRCK